MVHNVAQFINCMDSPLPTSKIKETNLGLDCRILPKSEKVEEINIERFFFCTWKNVPEVLHENLDVCQ